MVSDQRMYDPTLPNSFLKALPRLTPAPVKDVVYHGVVDPARRSVHNVVGQMDPNVIFSRDVLHQNKVLSSVAAHEQRNGVLPDRFPTSI